MAPLMWGRPAPLRQREHTFPHLFLRGLRREDFVQLEAQDLALVGEVEDGVVFRVEAEHDFGVSGVLLLLTDWPDAAEHTDVTCREQRAGKR